MCTAKTQYGKFETKIIHNFYIHESVSDLYIRYAYSAAGKYVNRSWE
jgi:hypothetical protein